MPRAKTIRYLPQDRTHLRREGQRRKRAQASRVFEENLGRRFHDHERAQSRSQKKSDVT
jgi:hypothetical protein